MENKKFLKMIGRKKVFFIILWIASAFCDRIYGQAPVLTPAPVEIEDPLEPLNRAIFDINLAFDDSLVEPVVQIYQTIFPLFTRDCLHAALQNLSQPLIFVNCLIQADAEKSGTVLLRFVVNSTFGLFGLFDVATELELPVIEEDFGKTLKMLDIPVGPYLVLPLLGPSSFRDGVGMGIDFFLNPLNILAARLKRPGIFWVRAGLDLFDRRAYNDESFSELKKTSLDLYATMRSLYDQKRGDKPFDSLDIPQPLEPDEYEIID